MDDISIYSDGLVTAMKQDKFIEAREYIMNLRKSLDSTLDYLNSQITLVEEQESARLITDPLEAATTNAERAVLAAKRAEEKAQRLEKATVLSTGTLRRQIIRVAIGC